MDIDNKLALTRSSHLLAVSMFQSSLDVLALISRRNSTFVSMRFQD